MTIVLDSWAVLRLLEDAGSAAGDVERLLEAERPLMSWINMGEVHYVLRRAHGEHAAVEAIRDLRRRIDTRLPDESAVTAAARIKADHAMSYADAFAAALAVDADAELWTGDPELLIDDGGWRWRDLRG
ncbi:PIN domain-containing protein [Iamia majanohamensis]|uniref:Ribonuclease VapC n=1 Tax=Iamia majanohamensis TaxID=467976 RepID=A0AAE9Y9S1_9ACTN|nr:PIN domain-containing protein [Iamia majanohamensis]WCO67258.1 PIN domain-containing protein [Iamia majanohamensis]